MGQRHSKPKQHEKEKKVGVSGSMEPWIVSNSGMSFVCILTYKRNWRTFCRIPSKYGFLCSNIQLNVLGNHWIWSGYQHVSTKLVAYVAPLGGSLKLPSQPLWYQLLCGTQWTIRPVHTCVFFMRFLMWIRVQNAPYPTVHECFFREASRGLERKASHFIWRHPFFQFPLTWRYFVAALRDRKSARGRLGQDSYAKSHRKSHVWTGHKVAGSVA